MTPNLPGWLAWRVARQDKPRAPGWTRRIPASMPALHPASDPSERPGFDVVRRYVKR